MSVYPNPTNDLITIQSSKSKIHSIEIYDLSGKKVFEQNGNESHSLSLHLDLNNGTYIIQVKTEKNSYSKLIVKN